MHAVTSGNLSFCFLLKPAHLLRPVFVNNPHLDALADDVLYHFSLGTKTHNLPAMFGDVKVIVNSWWAGGSLVLCIQTVFRSFRLLSPPVCVCWRQSLENEVIH